MKEAMLFGVVAFALLTVPQDVQSGPYSVESCLKSKLCAGLVDHFALSESSDSARYGALGSTLHEEPAVNLGTASVASGTGADFTGSYLWSSTFVPAMSSSWSVALWFKADTLPTSSPTDEKVLVSRRGPDSGTEIVLSGDSPNTKLCLYTRNREGTTETATCTSASISAGPSYFLAAGVGDDDDAPGALKAWVSLNGGAKETTTLNYIPFPGIAHLRMGQRPSAGKGAAGTKPFDGQIRSVDFFGRSLGPSEITLLYHSGVVLSYPYVTE